MGLDFYVSNEFNKNYLEYEFVELDEDLQGYIYDNREKINFDLKVIYGIDPYSDTIIENDSAIEIMIACQNILDSGYLIQYENMVQASTTILKLKELCEKAITNKQKLIAFGD